MAVSGNSLGECMNMHGVSFETGRFYVPGPDLCKMCVCDNGHPKGCKSVSIFQFNEIANVNKNATE